MNVPIASIIVPVFNVESYLKRCISSLCNQSFQDFELILVDDGSTDKSGIICDELASVYDKIRVIHKENGGPSSARNIGIENANGKYILFCDSDDEVENNWVETLIKYSDMYPEALVICGYDAIDDSTKKTLHIANAPAGVYKKCQYYELWGQTGSACLKTFRKDLIEKNHIRFDENVFYGEDVIFNLDYLDTVEKIYVIGNVLYHIHIYTNSRATLSSDVKYYQLKYIKDKREKYIDEKYHSDFYGLYFENILRRFYEILQNREIKINERLKEAKDILRDSIFIEYVSKKGESLFDSRSLKLIKHANVIGYYLLQKAAELKRQIIKRN